ncbi:hypothetical protein B2J86_17590 [Acidovorax sp. SRB_14]|uniref:DUF6172 family protein n=1 Tax=Acidovorax sp. SRB_14 TaxID=1962699 RepID=UPI001565C784|nr:DUF6172 family protein [Acidovorax sp. SRB_14]NMM82709.1 hypothetical protein [Acidovorax sp. SRB_14]
MRKTFQLRPEGKNPDRVLDATKHEIRKYLKRERSRALPESVDYWDFDCKFGPTQEAAVPARVGELIGLVDALAKDGGTQFYMEILACHGHRKAPPPADGAVAEPPTAAPFMGD